MDARLVLLKRVLEAAGEPLARTYLKDRLRLQKAVYLLQVAGVDLGYSYNWYLKGPYSTSLTRDYYEIDGNQDDPRQLSGEITRKVQAASKVFEIPSDLNIEPAYWYELLASVHYLKRQLRKSDDEARSLIESVKPHLRELYNRGARHLEERNLL